MSRPLVPSGGTDRRVNQPGEGEFLPNCNWQNEVTIARSGRHLVAGWNDSGQCDYLAHVFLQDVPVSLSGYGWSNDEGRTWHDAGTIQPGPGVLVWGDPVLAADRDGNFYYATLAQDSSGRSIIGVAKSTDEGKTFAVPVDASPDRHPAAFQDKEWIAVDATDSSYSGNVYVAWTEFYITAEVLFSRSVDGGRSFSSPVQLTEREVQRGNGTQVAVGPEGQIYVVWESFFSVPGLWFTRSLDGGVTFSIPRRIAVLERIGHLKGCFLGGTRYVLNGDIRVQEFPSMAVDTSGSPDLEAYDYNPNRGTIYVAVPSRGAGPDEADVFLLTSRDGGTTWSPPQKLNDDAATTDQFHPQVAVGPDGTVAVSWYDRRLSDVPLRPNWEIDAFAAVSTDDTRTFRPNVRVSDVSFPPAQTNPSSSLTAGCYMGEYNGMVSGSDPGQFFVAWGDNRDGVGLPDPNVYLDAVHVPMEAP